MLWVSARVALRESGSLDAPLRGMLALKLSVVRLRSCLLNCVLWRCGSVMILCEREGEMLGGLEAEV